MPCSINLPLKCQVLQKLVHRHKRSDSEYFIWKKKRKEEAQIYYGVHAMTLKVSKLVVYFMYEFKLFLEVVVEVFQNCYCGT
jgi:hypothetical protein